MLCSDERKLSTLQQRQKLCFNMLPISADTASGARRPGISHGSLVQRKGLAPPLLPRPTQGKELPLRRLLVRGMEPSGG